MIKPLHIWEDLFKFNFYVSRGVSPEIFKKQVIKYFQLEIDRELFDGYCVKISNTKDNVVWIWTRGKSIEILAHEISHAVWYALDTLPIKHTDDTDEVFAYLTGYLMKEILRVKK